MAVIPHISAVATASGTFLAIAYKEEIKNLISSIFGCLINRITLKLYIKRFGNEKVVYSIIKKLEETYSGVTNVVHQGNGSINYTLSDGIYQILWNKWPIVFKITVEDITMYTPALFNSDYLKMVLEDIYVPDSGSNDVLFFYLSNIDKWDVPFYRRPRKNIGITTDMQKVIDDVEHFYQHEDEYKDNGWAYRKGYLIEGEPGTGKSTIIEVLAEKFQMCSYLVNLNSNNMTDAALIRLVGSVPPRSLVVFDEFEKQYIAACANKHNSLTDGGILSAIDGAQRLSHGTIVLVIVNDKTKLPVVFLEALRRKGRLDESYQFH